MDSLDVRRLAAVDMHGIAGTSRRRQLIRAEFVAGAICGAGLGGWVAVASATAAGRWLGVWVVGVGVNYIALAWLAARLSRPGALDAELTGADLHADMRRYSRLQFWVLVPLTLAVLTWRQHRAGGTTAR